MALSKGKSISCKHKTVIAAKQKEAQKKLDTMVDPLVLAEAVHQDAMASVKACLDLVAETVIGCLEQRKVLLCKSVPPAGDVEEEGKDGKDWDQGKLEDKSGVEDNVLAEAGLVVSLIISYIPY
ncbi:hypothetical protein FRC07_005436 [Ceratobasidium sp. 392]|nr:hypothetical protein FRC07_005436 [Ceratobasidium sp. 392]